jgi:hypothetical protein
MRHQDVVGIICRHAVHGGIENRGYLVLVRLGVSLALLARRNVRPLWLTISMSSTVPSSSGTKCVPQRGEKAKYAQSISFPFSVEKLDKCLQAVIEMGSCTRENLVEYTVLRSASALDGHNAPHSRETYRPYRVNISTPFEASMSPTSFASGPPP